MNALTVFEVLDEAIEGRFIQEAGSSAGEGGWMVQAMAAQYAIRRGTCALWAVRLGKTGKVGQTTRTECIAKGARATEGAGVRQSEAHTI